MSRNVNARFYKRLHCLEPANFSINLGCHGASDTPSFDVVSANDRSKLKDFRQCRVLSVQNYE